MNSKFIWKYKEYDLKKANKNLGFYQVSNLVFNLNTELPVVI